MKYDHHFGISGIEQVLVSPQFCEPIPFISGIEEINEFVIGEFSRD